MSFRVELTPSARADLVRLFQFLLDRAEYVEDLEIAERALAAVESALAQLAHAPMIHRKAGAGPLRRELVIPFGASGYVALYEIVPPDRVLVLAVRHQLEQDYH